MASACSDLHKSEQLALLTKLEEKVLIAQTNVKKANDHELQEIQRYFAHHLKKIGDSLEGKEITKGTAYFLDSCKYLLHELSNYQLQKQYFDSTSTQSMRRIKDLHHDISEQTGDRKSYQTFIALEQKQVEQLIHSSNEIGTTSNEVTTMAKHLAVRLQDLTIHYKQQ